MTPQLDQSPQHLPTWEWKVTIDTYVMATLTCLWNENLFYCTNMIFYSLLYQWNHKVCISATWSWNTSFLSWCGTPPLPPSPFFLPFAKPFWHLRGIFLHTANESSFHSGLWMLLDYHLIWWPNKQKCEMWKDVILHGESCKMVMSSKKNWERCPKFALSKVCWLTLDLFWLMSHHEGIMS